MFRKTITRPLPEGAKILPGGKMAKLPDGSTVVINNSGRMVVKSDNWYARIAGVVTALLPKKKESELLEGELKARARRRALGLPEENLAPVGDILPLVANWLDELEIAGRNPGHIAKLKGRIHKTLFMAGVASLADLANPVVGDRIQRALAKIGECPDPVKLPAGKEFTVKQIRTVLKISPTAMSKLVLSRGIIGNGKTGRAKRLTRAECLELIAHRNKPRSVATVTGHRTAVLSFCRWLMKQGLLPKLPYLGLPGDVSKNRVRVRRTLTWDQCISLVNAVAVDGPHMGMTGPERACLYSLAFVSMLRRRALSELQIGDCHLTGENPFLSVRSEIDKTGVGRAVPLPPAIALRLAGIIKGKKKTDRVFDLPKETGKLVRHDLRLAKIPFRTVDGVVDLHSFRGSGASFLAEKGVALDLIARVGGWKDITTIFKNYRRFSVDSMGQQLRGIWPQ